MRVQFTGLERCRLSSFDNFVLRDRVERGVPVNRESGAQGCKGSVECVIQALDFNLEG
jgi:hypothetical protein